MAHSHPHTDRAARSPVHFIAMLILAAVVILVTLGVRDHKAPLHPHYDDKTPMTAPR